MTLSWNDYPEIAEKLEEKFGDVDLLNLEDKELRKMVLSLEDFEDKNKPDSKDIYLAIMTVWTELRYDDEGYDDSVYDAYV